MAKITWADKVDAKVSVLPAANKVIAADMNEIKTVVNGLDNSIIALDSDKQDLLVSGTNIKTVNGTTLLGSGDVSVQPVLVSGTNIKTINGSSLLGSGDITISSSSLYTGSDTVPSAVVATLTDTLSFSGGTLIVEGADTLSTSTAFKIYDGDTTPNSLWDFRNNGDVVTKAVGGLNRFSWYSDSELLFSHSKRSVGNIGIGLNHSYTNSSFYNTVIGTNAEAPSVNSTVTIGAFVQNRSLGAIAIGTFCETEAGYQRPIWIGSHGSGFGWGGDYSIRLGYTPTDSNPLTANEVFSINFNAEENSLFGRGNGSFGLIGKTNILRTDAIVETHMGTGGNTLVVTQHADKPTTNITDAIQVYADDWNGAGTTTLYLRNEEGDIFNIHKSTTSITGATFVANTGTNVHETSTFGGYTIAQVVQALKNLGILQ